MPTARPPIRKIRIARVAPFKARPGLVGNMLAACWIGRDETGKGGVVSALRMADGTAVWQGSERPGTARAAACPGAVAGSGPLC